MEALGGSGGAGGAESADGANGANSVSGDSRGTGQGTFSDRLRGLRLNTFYAGIGDAVMSVPEGGGGGGDGVLMNGQGPSGGSGQLGCTIGGNGYGAGGA